MSDERRLTPTAMVAGGTALARDDTGRVVFVEGALPGESVRARVTDTRADFARAVAIEILQPSPDRVLPRCPALAAGCGGCSWQHIAPEAQMRFKVGIVVDALRRIGRLREPPEPLIVPLDGPPGRTTARLAVSAEGRAGYRPRRGTGMVVETNSCLAAHPLVEELITAGRYPGSVEVLLRAGVASGERLVRTSPAGAAARVQVPPGVVVVGEGERAWVHETVAGRRLRVSADSFFQPGPAAAGALVAAVAGAVGLTGAGGHLVDAYAGVGLFASVLGARLGVRVTAIESNRSAVADARVNLADVDARVVTLDVAPWHPQRAGRPVDVVIADPPRPGLGRPGVAAVVAARAPRVVVVNCDPASLGRDSALLGQAGYQLASVAVVDAFPHTFHVETVSRFDRPGGEG
ncbi:MAG: TRAM domain-containing protein [Actinomycetota bacterium]|nr:TRAM domain-containing protein [Actinomycetota bacterium]